MSRNSFAYVSPMDLLELETLVSAIVGEFFSRNNNPRNLEITVTPRRPDLVKISSVHVIHRVTDDDYIVFDSLENGYENEGCRLIEGMDVVSWSKLLLQKVFQALASQRPPTPRFHLDTLTSHPHRDHYNKGEEVKLEVCWLPK